jgi:MinD-like ATPase involved in chromosome partitioning or flagellar assembly
VTVRRVLPVASGKGGVGKSTFATNFALALSRVAPTVLVDLDPGTSSIRNTIDAPVERDLYHFFRRGEPLSRCLTTLPERLDRRGLFKGFAFVAAPRHAMEEFTNLDEAHRLRLIRSINELPATYVVLDLRAGLDTNVLDFMPHSNSGILVFTPNPPSATLAAADIVKALLFRKLRIIFAPNGPLATSRAASPQLNTINALLDRVEDSYDDSLPNLDAFLVDLAHAFGETHLLHALADVVASFTVYFVLNFFDGVKESFEGAIAPFLTAVQRNVSANVKAHNLGWVVASPELHRANSERVPLLLQAARGGATEPERDRVTAELDELAISLGLAPKPKPKASPSPLQDYLLAIDPHRALAEQLEILTAMHRSTAAMHVRDNFAYIVRRVLHILATAGPDHFGQRRLLTPSELYEALLASRGALTPAGGGDAGATPLP